MNRLILTGAALLAFTSASLAQNTATLNQQGMNLSGQIDQVGKAQSATIQQTDSGNSAQVSQGVKTTPATGPNSASIQQTEDAQDNQASITQMSQNNEANVIQSRQSTANQVSITQSSKTGSTARVEQNEYSENNQARIEQTGDGGHTATIRQSGNQDDFTYSTLNQAQIHQSGRHQQATIQQDDYAGIGSITQSGSNHQALIHQTVYGLGAQATITQSGASNQASVTQGDEGYLYLATITQSGRNNQATVSQDLGVRYEAVIIQSGQNDQAFIKQTYVSDVSTAIVHQWGSGSGTDQAIINQDDAPLNKAQINQAGTTNVGNAATITQNATNSSFPPFGQNSAMIDQNTLVGGGGNLAQIQQGFDFDQPFTTQSTASVSQQGSFNQAQLQQQGELNSAIVIQWGNYNLLRNADGTEGSFAIQTGSNNTLTLTQTSSASGSVGNIANVSQLGSGNSATITQSLMQP